MSDSTKQQVVVVVDPYSSGKYLVQELKEQHWPMVAIQSSYDLADFWLQQFESSYFVDYFVFEAPDDAKDIHTGNPVTSFKGDINKLAKALTDKYDVVAITPGSEPGVLLAEDLQELLNMKIANGASTKEWRRHKYAMQERLREVGVRAVRQIYASTAKEACLWQKSNDKSVKNNEGNRGLWPIIVKPAMSGGTDGVYWCHNEKDVEHAFEKECGKVNVNGNLNDCLLAQEFLDGIEYIVDCVSYDSKHVVCGIWQYKKIYNPIESSITYEYAKFIESDSELSETLSKYMLSCLDALDIKYGASHGEVIMTKDGPCLVEVGARMHGLKGPYMTQLATGTGIHELVVDVLVNNGRLHQSLYEKNYKYSIKKFCFEFMLNNMQYYDHNKDDNDKTNTIREGVLTQEIDASGKLRSLPSCIAVYPSVHKGEILKITRDLATSPGCMMLCHPRLEQCWKDIEKVREWERSGELYKTVNVENYHDLKSVVNTPLQTDANGNAVSTPVNITSVSGVPSVTNLIPSTVSQQKIMISPFVASPKQEFCRDNQDDEFNNNFDGSGREIEFTLSELDLTDPSSTANPEEYLNVLEEKRAAKSGRGSHVSIGDVSNKSVTDVTISESNGAVLGA